MKNVLLIATLLLSACATTPTPTAPTVLTTRTYRYTIAATQSRVEVRAGQVGTSFCWTDSTLNGAWVCNNLAAGARDVPSGSANRVVFREDAQTAR